MAKAPVPIEPFKAKVSIWYENTEAMERFNCSEDYFHVMRRNSTMKEHFKKCMKVRDNILFVDIGYIYEARYKAIEVYNKAHDLYYELEALTKNDYQIARMLAKYDKDKSTADAWNTYLRNTLFFMNINKKIVFSVPAKLVDFINISSYILKNKISKKNQS